MFNICILSLIKDEHRYLDEWITYHHNIGINHFILIEDFNSKSHKEICDKYNYVDLFSIDTYLDQTNIFKDNQNSIENNRQYYIFDKFIQNHINNPIYDFLIFIDVDEFIELNHHKYIRNNIDSVLQRYLNIEPNANEYTIKWEFMTCKNPFKVFPYRYSVFDTYKMIAKIKSSKYLSKKTKFILNLRKLDWYHKINKKQLFKYLPHHLNYETNIISQEINIYDLRLNHYMTKSWKEYKNRLLNRGEIVKCNSNRTFENFFDINTHIGKFKKKLYLLLVKYKKTKINKP